VSGGAGTGKTVLAVEKARWLAGEGFRTLLTCFNLPLAGFLRAAAAAGPVENLSVLNFHELCRHLAAKAGISLPEFPVDHQPPQEYFDRTLPDALDAALRRLPENRFDAIVVDEGQDLREEWWLLLQMALADPDHGILHVFHDDNQAIYPRASGIPADLSPIALSRNLRNTRAIFGVARRFYGGKRVMAVGPTGQPVEFVTASGPAEVEKAVSRLLHRIIHEEGVPACDVALLTGRAREKSAFGRLATVGAYGLTQDQQREPDQVLFETVFRFKGLERPVVILVELDERLEREEVLYVGLTRARAYLAVVGETRTLELLKQRDETD
jgi:superfamily I DNA/RNA helicase